MTTINTAASTANVQPPLMTGDAIQQFREAILSAGLTPPDVIEADGALHRFSSNGKRGDDSGFYVLHLDGIPAGAFGDWRSGIKQAWHERCERKLTPKEIQAHRERVAEMRAARKAAEVQRQQDGAEAARNLWASAAPAPDSHAYLARKKIKPHGVRVDGEDLIVPLTIDGVIVNVQRIKPDGEKRFLLGGRTSGCFLTLGQPSGVLLVCEGLATAASIREATGSAVVVAFSASNLKPVAMALREKFPELRIVICGDNDASGTGQRAALEAARAVGGAVAIPQTEGRDWNDVHCAEGLDAVRAAIEGACESEAEPNTEADERSTGDTPGLPPLGADAQDKLARLRELLPKLAALKPLDYAARRAAIAKEHGVSVGALDAEVNALREPEELPNSVIFVDTTPASEAVDGGALLYDLRDIFKRHVILPEHAAETLALWALMTWTIESFDLLPMLHISSPQKRCGKSTLMSLLHELVRRALLATSATPAALFRLIEQHAPTLLLDEADAWMRENEELRGIINGGHTRKTARVLRVVGDDHDVASFSTFCPKVISGIGHVADTVEDRSITIAMQRKLPGDSIESMRGVNFEPVRARCARWAADHEAALKEATPEIPSGLDDRAADNWAPLFTIASIADGEWSELARKAAAALSGGREDQSAGALLLADIRDLFDVRTDDPVPSAVIVDHLVTLEGRPWPEWRHGKPMSPAALARMLRGFEIQPRTIRTAGGPGGTAKGYHREQFADAFRRYLPDPADSGGDQTVTASQPLEIQGKHAFSRRNIPGDRGEPVTVAKCEKPYKNQHCDDVTVSGGESI